MPKSGVLELTVETLAAGGSGISRLNGRPVFIDFCAPGDRVRAVLTEDRTAYCRAQLLEVIEASELRVEAPCPLFTVCGGCSLQHLSLPAQLAAKSQILSESCQKIGGFEPPEITVFESAGYGYRNRLQFHRVKPAKPGSSHIGLKKRRSATILPLDDCPVADAAIRRALQNRQLNAPPWLDRFTVYGLDRLLLSEGGLERGQLKLAGKELQIDVGCFFQSNASAFEALIEQLRKIIQDLPKQTRFLDLYGGVGSFAVCLANQFEVIDLVDSDKRAVAVAKANLGDQANCFALSDDAWVRQHKGRQSYDFIIVDPPRLGLSGLTVAWLASAKATLLAYVACNPASFARDARILSNGGWELRSLKLFDFYPQTAHIESLAVFQRAAN